jgi:hypothetical protein
MKMTKFILSFVLTLIPFLVRAEPASPAEFIAAYRTAMQEKSIQKLNALTYFVGMAASDKQQTDSLFKMEFDQNGSNEIADISLDPLPDDFHPINVMAGKKWEPTYPPAGLIKILYKGTANGPLSSAAPYAIIGGHYYLTSVKSTDLNWKGAPDRSLIINALSSSPTGIRLIVRWNVSGIEQQQTFKTPSVGLMGQYFEHVTATSLDDGGNLTLVILEGGNEVFHSQPLKGKGSIEYAKK